MDNDKSIYSIVGLVVSIASLFAGTLGIVAILGLVFSILGIKNTESNTSSHKIAIAGLIVAIIGIILWIVRSIISISAIPSIHIQ